MITLDTNVVVRIIVGDDASQTKRAFELVDRSGGRIGATVLLEAAWVLTKSYSRSQTDIAYAFVMLASVDKVEVPSWTSRLGECVEAGLTVADAIQLFEAVPEHPFATFDNALVMRAPRVFATPKVITP